ALLVPRDAPGLSVRESSPRWQHGACGSVMFDHCRVPAQNFLPADAALFADEGRRIPQEQALALGIGRAAYEATLDYAQRRVQGGRPIIEHQAIGAKLAEIAVRLEVARATIWRAAWASDHPEALADASLPDLPLSTIAAVFDWEIIKKGSKLGFRTMAVPKEWGGHGTDFVTQALVMAELAKGDSAISKTFSQCWKWSHLIAAACSEEQKRRFLKPFLEDDTF